ncbi:MAG: 4-hydroxybenzoyl-CoA reductase [Actinobacteria bacterium]|nr:4-hydroxybenzoyl-CoA reductase [Actinomycetota bacterium]
MELARPATVDEAVRILDDSEGEGKLIAGGTAVVLMMRQGLISPPLLVSLQDVQGMTGIDQAGGSVRIGSRVTLGAVASSELVRAHAPALAHACNVVGNLRVRNVATLAGNLAEADYASDAPSVLTCIGATCSVQGPDGSRTLPISELITGFYSTALGPAEVIKEVSVPMGRRNERTAYLKYVSRSSEDRPCVGVAARALFDDGAVKELNVVIAGVAGTPAVAPHACDLGIGRPLEDGAIADVAEAYADSIDPMEDARGSAWYRTQMIRVFVTRALQTLREPA